LECETADCFLRFDPATNPSSTIKQPHYRTYEWQMRLETVLCGDWIE